ncbi:hypothetical protein J2W17_005268 [Pseudomonas lini]|nr:hypothetical protein [Pseudomonas lini]
MLAMVVNDNAGCLTPSGVLRFIASMLAPTGLRYSTCLMNGLEAFPPTASRVESPHSSPVIPRRVYELKLKRAAIPQSYRQLPDTRPLPGVPDVNRSSLPF